MASAPTPGLTMGSTISQKVRSSPAPSILAASRSSEGRVSENCFIKNTPNGQLTVRGAIDEVYEKIGLRLTFDDPFDPVEMVDKKEQDK